MCIVQCVKSVCWVILFSNSLALIDWPSVGSSRNEKRPVLCHSSNTNNPQIFSSKVFFSFLADIKLSWLFSKSETTSTKTSKFCATAPTPTILKSFPSQVFFSTLSWILLSNLKTTKRNQCGVGSVWAISINLPLIGRTEDLEQAHKPRSYASFETLTIYWVKGEIY